MLAKADTILGLTVCLLSLLSITSCTNAPTSIWPPLRTGSVEPAVVTSTGATSNSSTAGAATNPLVAQYTISPLATASVYVEFGPTTAYGFDTSPVSTPNGGGQVNILVAGMTQNTTYHMRAVVAYANGGVQYDSDHTFTTGPVAANLIPQVSVTTSPGMTPAPGVEFSCLSSGSEPPTLGLAAFNPEGNLIWYYNYNLGLGIPTPAKLLPNGNILLLLIPAGGTGDSGVGEIQEIDLAGNVIRQFSVSDLNKWLVAAGYKNVITSINHDLLYLPNGHLLVIASEYRAFENLPGYPGETNVLGSDIIDVAPSNTIAWFWSAFNYLDVNRHPYLFPDWTHANSLAYSSDDGDLLLSLRHQNWVIKIDYENGSGSGNILWKLGYQGDFALNSSDPANWFYAQHDASILSPNSTGNFTLGVFDNGNDRVMDSNGDVCGTPGQPACYSRSAIFDVNETNMTAQLDWAYTLPFSPWGGVTQLLPNGDVYIDETDVNNSNAQIMEVTQTSTPQVVWQMIINGQNSYRTINLPSLYPGVQWNNTQ